MNASSMPAARGMFCLKCFYDLRGTPSLRCPECGNPFSPTRPASYSPVPHATPVRDLIDDLADVLVPQEDPEEQLRSLRNQRWTAQSEMAWQRDVVRALREYLDWTLAVIEDNNLMTPEQLRMTRDEIARATTHPLEQLGTGAMTAEAGEPVSAELMELSRAAFLSGTRRRNNPTPQGSAWVEFT